MDRIPDYSRIPHNMLILSAYIKFDQMVAWNPVKMKCVTSQHSVFLTMVLFSLLCASAGAEGSSQRLADASGVAQAVVAHRDGAFTHEMSANGSSSTNSSVPANGDDNNTSTPSDRHDHKTKPLLLAAALCAGVAVVIVIVWIIVASYQRSRRRKEALLLQSDSPSEHGSGHYGYPYVQVKVQASSAGEYVAPYEA